MLKTYLLPFLPLFFAVNVIAILPIFLALTSELSHLDRIKIVNKATITGFIIAIVFLFVGKWIFKILGITIGDFKIAGGLLLLIFAMQDLINPEATKRRSLSPVLALFPLATPLIVGPAVLTTLLLSVDTYGYLPTLVAMVSNMVVVWVTFRYSDQVLRVIGASGAAAMGKIFSLLLCAVAVMMIRHGGVEVIQWIKALPPAS